MRVAAVNPVELLTWWEGRGRRRPLSLRALAAKLGISETTVRNRLRTLRTLGQVDDTARAQALATRGGHRRGGRPAKPLADADLLAAWSKASAIATTARDLHVSRSRVRRRLRELGLLSEEPQRRRPEAPGRTTDAE